MLRFLTALAIAVLPLSVSAETNGKFFDSNGVQIHYYDQGAGEPVVLVHGLTGTAAIWDMLGVTAALTEAGYRAIALDARGHENPPNTDWKCRKASLDYSPISTRPSRKMARRRSCSSPLHPDRSH